MSRYVSEAGLRAAVSFFTVTADAAQRRTARSSPLRAGVRERARHVAAAVA